MTLLALSLLTAGIGVLIGVATVFAKSSQRYDIPNVKKSSGQNLYSKCVTTVAENLSGSDHDKHAFIEYMYPQRSRLKKSRRGIVADSADASWSMVANWLSINPAVYDAFEQFTGDSIENIFDFSSVVEAHTYKYAAEAFQRNIGGHVSEFEVAEHLKGFGHEVSIPLASNAKGIDLLVGDTSSVQVKDYGDIHQSGIYKHFVGNPDVPIIVPHNALNLPPDAHYISTSTDFSYAADGKKVFVDPLLSHGDGLESWKQAMQTIDPYVSIHDSIDELRQLNFSGAADALGAHIPIVTVAMSSMREFELLTEGNTSVVRALKNVAVDTAGVSVGGVLGAKGGAILGSVVLPGPGTLMGGLFGTIVGALAGKFGATELRQRKLQKAIVDYELTLGELSNAMQIAEESAKSTWVTKYDDAQIQLLPKLIAIKERAEMEVRRQVTEAEVVLKLEVADCAHVLSKANSVLEKNLASAILDSRGHGASRLVSLVGVWRLRRAHARWNKEAQKVLGSYSDSEALASGVLDLLCASTSIEKFAVETSIHLIDCKIRASRGVSNTANHFINESLKLRQEAIRSLCHQWSEIRNQVRRDLAPILLKASKALELLDKEARSVGVIK